MKIRRFVAKDMRTALANIKDELGPDAVIMSNKKIVGGVELMAAVDYSTATPEPKQHKVAAKEPVLTNNFTERDVDEDVVSIGAASSKTAHVKRNEQADSLAALLARQEKASPAEEKISPTHNDQPLLREGLKSFAEKLAQQSAETDDVEQPKIGELKVTANAEQNVSKQEFDGVKRELGLIRELLQHQVSGLMWQDIARNEPIRAMLVKKLRNMGLTAMVADQLACFISDDTPEHDAWQAVMDILAQQITTTNNDILHRGGVVSLVGPTGVGKTTTVAKLAARCAQMHGVDSVALISTDTYRVAGFEQLQTYGKIIGCPVKLAKDNDELNQLLAQFKNKKLVLIDTAGLGQRDIRLAKQLSYLVNKANVRIKNYLVLSANTQQQVMKESVAHFKQIPLAGCIFTKLDECLSLGEIISTAIQNALPIGYLTDGQRVPEDIKVANAQKLVKAAEKLAENCADDYDWMPLVANNSAMI